MLFQERFLEILKLTPLKQNQIATLCEIDKSCITQYKNGKTQPTLDVLYKLCKALDVSADYLLGLTDY